MVLQNLGTLLLTFQKLILGSTITLITDPTPKKSILWKCLLAEIPHSRKTIKILRVRQVPDWELQTAKRRRSVLNRGATVVGQQDWTTPPDRENSPSQLHTSWRASCSSTSSANVPSNESYISLHFHRSWKPVACRLQFITALKGYSYRREGNYFSVLEVSGAEIC